MKIAIAAIDIPKDHPRRDHASAHIDALAASMGSAAGQTDPIRVVNNGNSFILVKGLARVLAARKLGWEDIEAEPAPGFMPEQMAAHYAAATAIRALAPPDADLIVGRLRWVETRDGWEDLASGRILWGAIGPCPGGWQAVKGRMFDHLPLAKTTRHDTPEAARAALVEAVRREVEGGGDAA